MPILSTLGSWRHRIRTKASPNHRKVTIVGLNMLLETYMIFSYCISYRELKPEWQLKLVSVEDIACLNITACPVPTQNQIIQLCLNLHILSKSQFQ